MEHIHPLPPATESKRAELEREIEAQKARFLAASRRGIDAMRNDLSLMNWIRDYPREAAILIVMSGFVAARMLRARHRPRYGSAQELS